jgi:riboflavin kinase/FMN adenylyltransferase
MEVVFGPENCSPAAPGTAVTIGAYDGVHLGHQHLVARLREQAERRGLSTVVVTFDRHPAMIVRPDSAPTLLTDLDQKLELLAATGVDCTVVIHFDEGRAAQTAENFIMETLVDGLRARLVVVGQDFHFGHSRTGNVALLSDMGERNGFDVVGLGLEADATGGAVSSTRVRSLLAGGDVAGAARLLGRCHQVRGVVARGDGRGKVELGFPTANVAVPDGIALPAEGIYACWYRRDEGSVHPAAVSVGRRPTFYPDGGALLLEAYLLDFDGELYGEKAQVSFVSRLRDDKPFDTVAELVTQMTRDVAATRHTLVHSPP